MNKIQCVVKDSKEVRCGTTIEVSEPVSAEYRFICKNHPDAVQRRAAGNTKSPRPDVHFQEVQFDPDLQQRSTKPQGTSHIDNQGDMHPSAEAIRRSLEAAGIKNGE